MPIFDESNKHSRHQSLNHSADCHSSPDIDYQETYNSKHIKQKSPSPQAPDLQRITRSKTGSLPKEIFKYKLEELISDNPPSTYGNRSYTRRSSRSNSRSSNERLTTLEKVHIKSPKNRANVDKHASAIAKGQRDNHGDKITDSDSPRPSRGSGRKRRKINHDASYPNLQSPSVSTSVAPPSMDQPGSNSDDPIKPESSDITSLDRNSTQHSEDSQHFYNGLSSLASSPQYVDDNLDYNIRMTPLQSFQLYDAFGGNSFLNSLGPDTFDTLIEQSEDIFDIHFLSATVQKDFRNFSNESAFLSHFHEAKNPKHMSTQKDLSSKENKKVETQHSSYIYEQTDQNMEEKLSTLDDIPVGDDLFSDWNFYTSFNSPIHMDGTENVLHDCDTLLPVLPFSPDLNMYNDDKLKQLSCISDIDIVDNLALTSPTESTRPYEPIIEDQEETSVSALWSRKQQSRSNSFFSLVNGSSFKHLASAISKNPCALEYFSKSEKSTKNLDPKSLAHSDSIEDFLNLDGEADFQGTLNETSDKNESNSGMNKVPLCGYRYRNDATNDISNVMTTTPSSKKILAALASFSTEHEKLVASFPSIPNNKNNNNSPTDSGNDMIQKGNTNDNKLLMTNNSESPTTGLNVMSTSSSSDTSTHTTHTTRSGLEYNYQQAVVAASGLNVQSLYSGKGREMITGSDTW